MAKATLENDSRKILYIGPDKTYWENVKELFDRLYGKMVKLEFEDRKETADKAYIELFHNIIEQQYNIVFADYSFKPEMLLKLTYLLRKNHSTRHIIVIGLFDHKTPMDICEESLRNGVLVNQLKMGEDVFDTVYSCALLSFYEKVDEPDFVRVRIKEGMEIEIAKDMRINYIAEDHISVESEYALEVDEDVIIETKIPERSLPSKQFHVAEVNTDGDRFYGKPFKMKLEFNYLDKLVLSSRADNIEKAKYEEDLEKREKEIEERSKPKFLEWFKEQKTSRPQYVKLLIIDRNASVLEQSGGWIKDHDHGIHLQLNTFDIEKEVRLFYPSIIAIHQDKLPSEFEEGDGPQNYNDESAIAKVVGGIKAINGYTPYVVVFGSDMTADALQQKFGYKNIIANKLDINIKFMFDLAQMYEEKFKVDIYRSLKEVILLRNKDKMSVAIHKSPVKIINMNESTFEIVSQRELPLYSVYKISKPSEVYFTVIPHRKSSQFSSEKNCYRGVFHSYNVGNKNKLRQFIISKE